MRKRIIMGVAGAGLVLVGILAGFILSGGVPVFASRNYATGASVSQATPGGNATSYCQLYIQTLANQLGVSESKLESANSVALQTVIKQMAKDGTITSQQESNLLQKVQQYGSAPCSHLNQFAHWARGNHYQMLAGARQSIVTAVAASLGISSSTLESDLKAGQTVPEIAKARNVSLSAVNAAYLGAVKSVLSQAVSKNEITQDESNTIYGHIAAAVNAGRYPLLGGASGRCGCKQAASTTGA
jgi:hypothetical protein